MDSRAMLAISIVAVSCASPMDSETAKRDQMDSELPLDQLKELPEIAELKDLKCQINVLFIPAFQSLYFKVLEEVKYSTGKKMVKIRKKLKEAKTHLSAKKKILVYLQKYQKQLNDLKNFELVTDVDVLDSTLSSRQFIFKNLENKLRLAVNEISESIQEEEKEINYKFKSKEIAKPLLRFANNGDFSYMTQYDIYYLNHLSEFLDYSIEQLRRKRIEEKRQLANFPLKTLMQK